MYHPRFSGTHYEMGAKFGTIIKKGHIKFPIQLDGFQLEHGIESGKLLQEYFPEVTDEIRGITEVAGIDNQKFTAWMMCMGCCMYNLEDAEKLEVRGCTAFSFAENDMIIYGRDNDLPPFLKKGCKSVVYRPDVGNSFILNTSSFVNGEEGMNQYGLTVAMTFVMPKLEEIRPGFNSVFIVRYLLEKCSTVEECSQALHTVPIASSCNILLADVGGNMAVAECSPFKIHIRQPETNGNGRKFIITVNHFTSEKMEKYDADTGNGDYFSKKRYRTAFHALMNEKNTDPIEFSKNILSGRYGFMCQYDNKLDFDTVWSSIFELKTGDVYCAEGNPSRTRYKKDMRFATLIKGI